MPELTPKEINSVAIYAFRHYVSLSYYAKSPELCESRGGLAQACVVSAFVMRVRDIWCLVTAGHVLDGIDEDRKRGIQIDTFRIWDGWAFDATHKDYVPFDFDEAPKFRLNEGGLDYGLIPLKEYYVKHLMANKVVPVGEESYEKTWPEEFHGYAMIGVAGSTVSLEQVGERSTLFSQSLSVIHLAPEPNPPEALIQSVPRFYARLLTPEDAPEWLALGKDIAGMSGGPIIGVRRDDEQTKYWVVGVQSGWLKERRIIAACHFQSFARFVGEMIDEEST